MLKGLLVGRVLKSACQAYVVSCVAEVLDQLAGTAVFHGPLDLHPELIEKIKKNMALSMFNDLVRVRRRPAGLDHIFLSHPSSDDIASSGSHLLPPVLDEAFDSCLFRTSCGSFTYRHHGTVCVNFVCMCVCMYVSKSV